MIVLPTLGSTAKSRQVCSLKELKKIGVVPKDHMVAAQPLPGTRFDLTFKLPAFRDLFLPGLKTIPGSQVTVVGSYTIVTIFHLNMETDSNIVKQRLSQYGEVISGRHCTFAEEPDCFNGTRQFKMRVKKSIPTVLRIGDRDAWVSYVGQTRTCARCGAPGHMSKD